MTQYTAESFSRPLNRDLHRLLAHTFGKVTIGNAGLALVAAPYLDSAGRQRLNIHEHGETCKVNCPYCHDTQQRLWINHRYGQHGPDGQRMIHLAKCFNENCLANWENRKDLDDKIFGFMNLAQRKNYYMQVDPGHTEPVRTGPAKPPGMLVSLLQLQPNHPAVQYMIERRYTPEMLQRYQITYCIEADREFYGAQGRIIFPIYFDNVLVGWQGRYVGKKPPEGVPKYYTMKGMQKTAILYNYDAAKHKSFVVVVEGVTDVHSLGDNGVALLGKSLSSNQRMLLQRTWADKPIVFLLDPDAGEDSRRITAEIDDMAVLGRSPIVRVELPGTLDPGDYDHVTLLNIICTQARKRGVILTP